MSSDPDLKSGLESWGEEEDAVGYPKELKAMVLQRMMAPGNETIGMLAKEFNVTEATLYAWRRCTPGGVRP